MRPRSPPRPPRAAGLNVIGASAGTGKTYRLTQEVERALIGEDTPPIRTDGLVAVTYTRRAQVELESRIRRKLLTSKAADRAARLPQAYLGTVHAVCLRWVRELALDAGVSPHVEVLEDGGLALATVLEETIDPADRDELDDLAERLQIHVNQQEGQVHWDQPVEDVITLARSGRIAPAELAAMADRSSRSYLELFHEPVADGPSLDETLEAAVETALASIDTRADSTGVTKSAVDALQDYRRASQYGRATWAQWLKLAQVKAAKASDPLLEATRAAAASWVSHPQLREDVQRFTLLVYRAAAVTLERYASWKRQRGLVDYVDMIDGALTLLEDPEVAADLAEKLQLVVVDELQDSSPIQLALFLRLHLIAGRSTWVGDPKQCIFEYAGADPALMDCVLRWAHSAGGKRDRQTTNYRSRRCLVELCNAVFTGVFGAHGLEPADITVAAHRDPKKEPELEPLPPLGLFYYEGNATQQAAAIAAGVARVLASPEQTPIRDRLTGEARAVQPHDVAILVATNSEGRLIAEALAALGLRATFARTGLLSTPEGVAVAAALRFLLDARDSLATAEIEALHGWNDTTVGEWFSHRLAAPDTDEPANPAPWRKRLDALRASVVLLSPQELVEAVLVALDLPSLAARWPDPAQRLANLDALRRFARIYERRCIDSGEGCSLSGLVRFLEGLTRTTYRHGEERSADTQHTGGDAAGVTVMTYHRSKGLEWPVVILSSLDRDVRPRTFEVSPELATNQSTATLDPDNPLAGRWIRYWPWPFGNPKTKASLRDRAEQSSVGLASLTREREERARLLYVGFTRARDHLVLATKLTRGVPQCQWLSELTNNGAPAIALPGDPTNDALTTVAIASPTGKLTVPARLFRLAAADVPTMKSAEPERRWFARSAPPVDLLPYWIRPSAVTEFALTTITAIHEIHPPLVRNAASAPVWNVVGDALHAFLAADVEGLEPPARFKLAARLITAFAIDAFAPQAFLDASDAFADFVRSQLPGARWLREIPIEARIASPLGERAIDGRMDLLLETDDALIIVDHKSFPGAGEAAWRQKAADLSGQLATYARALALARNDKPIHAWLHFATSGAVVRFAPFATPNPSHNDRLAPP